MKPFPWSHKHRIVREPRSKLVVWSERFETGIRKVDEQHRELAGIINQLSDAMYSGKGRNMMGRTLATLEKYAAYHFSTEENLMASHGYPDLAEHRKGHESFSGIVLEYRQKFEGDGIVVPAEILCFMGQWIISHIMDEDMEFGRLLKRPEVARD